MSLLMDALRKAEEAKRRAAQESEQVTASAPEAPVLVSAEQEASPDSQPASDIDLTFDDLPELAVAAKQPNSSLDIPLDFYLDTEPAIAAKPETAVRPESQTAPVTVTAEQSETPSDDPATFGLKLMALPPEPDNRADLSLLLYTEDTTQTDNLIHEVSEQIHKVTPTSALSLSAGDGAADTHVAFVESEPEPDEIAFLAQAAPSVPLTAKSSGSSAAAKEKTDVSEKARISEKPVSMPSPAGGTGKDKLSARRSARAVFAAKSGASAGNKRVIILGSAAACLLLAAAGGWFFLNNATSGNQYNIPASFDQTALSNDQIVDAPPIDVTTDTGVAQTITDTSNNSPEAINVEPDQIALTAATTLAATDSVPAGDISAQNTTPDMTSPATSPAASVSAAQTVSEAAQAETASSMAVSSGSASGTAPAALPETMPESTAETMPEVMPETEPAIASATSVSTNENAQTITPAPVAELPVAIEPVTIQSTSPIQISRSQPMRNPDMQMLTAWSAYQQGDFAAARILYQQSLAINPDNRDALLGVAASAMQQGDMASARQTYARLLSMNPRDPLARTGMLESTAAGDPIQRESDLKALLSDHPDLAAISYALGNLYASQQRWHEAQQAYYNALLSARSQATGPVSPDYAFNLAISLERINQPQAALNFYREAKVLSNDHTSGFDMAVLEQRLQALERVQP